MTTNMILQFERTLDATEMSCQEIYQYIKDNGWGSFECDWDEFMETNRLILIRKAA